MINTKGLRPTAVLAALYNASQPLGIGMLHFDRKRMTEDEAAAELKFDDDHAKMFPHVKETRGATYFDYLKGRVMKVDLKDPDGFDEFLYDRDNGPGSAQRAIASIEAAA